MTHAVKPARREINDDVCQLSGFITLQWTLPRHAAVSQLYLLLMALLLGQPVRDVPTKMQVHPSPPDSVGTLANVSLNSFTARTASRGRTHQDAGTPLPSRLRWNTR